LADYAGQLTAEAARRVASSLKTLHTKEAELAQLRGYLAEYRQRAERDELTDTARWRNTRSFLAKLSEAVAHHEVELAKAVEKHRLDADRWRDCEQRSKTLDKVVERSNRNALYARERRTQAELDERAARRRS
jgi:flagellar export protein FliJ